MKTSLIVVFGAGLGGVLRPLTNAWITPMVGAELPAGILGGSTTFLAVSLDAALLDERGQPWLAADDVAASVLLSIDLFAALWGMRVWSS